MFTFCHVFLHTLFHCCGSGGGGLRNLCFGATSARPIGNMFIALPFFFRFPFRTDSKVFPRLHIFCSLNGVALFGESFFGLWSSSSQSAAAAESVSQKAAKNSSPPVCLFLRPPPPLEKPPPLLILLPSPSDDTFRHRFIPIHTQIALVSGDWKIDRRTLFGHRETRTNTRISQQRKKKWLIREWAGVRPDPSSTRPTHSTSLAGWPVLGRRRRRVRRSKVLIILLLLMWDELWHAFFTSSRLDFWRRVRPLLFWAFNVTPPFPHFYACFYSWLPESPFLKLERGSNCAKCLCLIVPPLLTPFWRHRDARNGIH